MTYTGETFKKALPVIYGISERIFFDCSGDFLEFQAVNTEQLEKVRNIVNKAAQLTEPWKKHFNEACNWWEYFNETSYGLKIRIYADKDGPNSCTKVIKTRMVEQNVPIVFEKQLVAITTVEWECPDDKEEKENESH